MSIKKAFTALAMSAACATSGVVLANPVSDFGNMLPYGRSLTSVDQVKKALNEGAVVSAAVDLSQCSRPDGGAPSETQGGLEVSPYRIKGDGSLSFSDTHFTVSTRTGSPVPITQFLRYTVAPSGDITVSSYIFSMPYYNLMSEVSFDCSINEGVSFNAAL